MQSRYFSVTVFFVTIFAIILVLLTADSIPTSTFSPTYSPADTRDALVERLEVQVDVDALISKTIEPDASQVTSLPDGRSLLDSHCTRCHIAQWLIQIKEPRAEWEKILEQMEGIGVYLSDTEKLVLLDYLVVTGEP
jgi:hypothetical protein